MPRRTTNLKILFGTAALASFSMAVMNKGGTQQAFLGLTFLCLIRLVYFYIPSSEGAHHARHLHETTSFVPNQGWRNTYFPSIYGLEFESDEENLPLQGPLYTADAAYILHRYPRLLSDHPTACTIASPVPIAHCQTPSREELRHIRTIPPTEIGVSTVPPPTPLRTTRTECLDDVATTTDSNLEQIIVVPRPSSPSG